MQITCGFTTNWPLRAACRSSLDSRSRVSESMAVCGLGRGSQPAPPCCEVSLETDVWRPNDSCCPAAPPPRGDSCCCTTAGLGRAPETKPRAAEAPSGIWSDSCSRRCLRFGILGSAVVVVVVGFPRWSGSVAARLADPTESRLKMFNEENSVFCVGWWCLCECGSPYIKDIKINKGEPKLDIIQS